MTYIVNIGDKTIARYLLGIMKNLPTVTTKKAVYKKSSIIKNLDKAIKEVNDIKAGKKTARNARDFLNELQG